MALFENEPFDVIGRLIPRFESGVWSFSEQLFDAPFQKTYEVICGFKQKHP